MSSIPDSKSLAALKPKEKAYKVGAAVRAFLLAVKPEGTSHAAN